MPSLPRHARALHRSIVGSLLLPLVVSVGCTSEDGTPDRSAAGNATGVAASGGANGNSASSDPSGGADTQSNSSVPDGIGGKASVGGASASDTGGASSATLRGGSSAVGTGGSNSNPTSANTGGATNATGGRVATGGMSQGGMSQGGVGQSGTSQGGRSSTRNQGGGAGRAQGGGVATGGRAQGGTSSLAQGGSSALPTGGITGGGSSGLSSFAQQFVDAHNAVRAAVTQPAGYTGTWVPIPNVTWSDTVAASAQNWVNHLRDVENCGLVHEGSSSGYGENLAAGTNLTPQAAVDMWASEKSKYTWSAKYTIDDFNLGSGHYTQLVWRKSIQIGCASATCGKSVVISCRYSPPGNVVGGTQSVY